MPSNVYRDPHYKPETVWRPSQNYNGNPYANKTASSQSFKALEDMGKNQPVPSDTAAQRNVKRWHIARDLLRAPWYFTEHTPWQQSIDSVYVDSWNAFGYDSNERLMQLLNIIGMICKPLTFLGMIIVWRRYNNNSEDKNLPFRQNNAFTIIYRLIDLLSYSIALPRSHLTHWGWMTHICASKQTIIGSYNGLSPVWSNDGILLIGTLVTNFNEILGEIYTFSFIKNAFEIVVGQNSGHFAQGRWVKGRLERQWLKKSRDYITIGKSILCGSG